MAYNLEQYRIIDPFIERDWLSANKNYVTMFPRPDVRDGETVEESLATRPLLGAMYVGTDTTNGNPPLSLIYKDRLTGLEDLEPTRGTSSSINIAPGRCSVGGIYAELPEIMNISVTEEDNYFNTASYTAATTGSAILVITFGPTDPEVNDFILSFFEYSEYISWCNDSSTTNFEKSAIIIGFANVSSGAILLDEDVYRSAYGDLEISGFTYIIPNLNPLDCGIVIDDGWCDSADSGWGGFGNSD